MSQNPAETELPHMPPEEEIPGARISLGAAHRPADKDVRKGR